MRSIEQVKSRVERIDCERRIFFSRESIMEVLLLLCCCLFFLGSNCMGSPDLWDWQYSFFLLFCHLFLGRLVVP